ncbi:MAG: XdhC family protein [Leeuwenhoekiella sp.]
MTHEFINIIEQYQRDRAKGVKTVLATVVALDGSSYRKPGVRMLISEDGLLTGAVSGGCVEKEVQRRAQGVFKDHQPKVIAYDGRYRLGCEGILFILLEIFEPNSEFLDLFFKSINGREPFVITSYYNKEDESFGNFGSVFYTENGEKHAFSEDFEAAENTLSFTQKMQPRFRLVVIGGEHDAVKLCSMAALLGWQVDVINSIKDPKTTSDFPGANAVINEAPETIIFENFDTHTAVVLMTHNYAQDLRYLLKISGFSLAYLGLLGSSNRREQLQNDLFEYLPEVALQFLEEIHSPAGLNLGAITPEEIALSILSEIIAVTRDKKPFSLKEVTGKIHS